MKRGNLSRRMAVVERLHNELKEQILQHLERILGPNPTDEQLAELIATLESTIGEQAKKGGEELHNSLDMSADTSYSGLRLDNN
jgi:hypothetical protein